MNERETGNDNSPIDDMKKANQEIGGPGWHSRGYLPHIDGDGKIQHVSFHLADSLPEHVVEQLEKEIKAFPVEKRDIERRKRVEAWVDAGHGSCVLRIPDIGRMVQESLLFFNGQRYRVIAWVIMPNHVHILFQPMHGWTVGKIVASWKKFTARGICDYHKSRNAAPGNANLPIGNITTPVWHREYWDRFIRDDRHFQQAVEYIHLNPVKAGLVARAEEWPWSSASTVYQNANREIGVPG